MGKPVILGIDAGTTKIKAGLVDADGNLIDMESEICEVLSPFEGAYEMDMGNTWEIVCKVTGRLFKRNENMASDLAGVGVTGQGDGLWPVSKNGLPARRAILWNDTRARKLSFEKEDLLKQVCIKCKATPIFAGAAPVLLRWLLEKEPETVKNIAYILHCKDWINYKLTGQIATDYTDASTASINVFEKAYAEEFLSIMDLLDYKNLFPDLFPSHHVIGKVTEIASRETGIPQNIPVIAGAIDVAAAAFGVGLRQSMDACTIVGTTLCNEMILDKENVHHEDTRGSNLCYVIPDKYLRVMATQNGTSTLDRMKSLLACELSFGEIESNIEKLPVGSDGVIIQPYFYGERAPFRNPAACAGIYGLTARHGRFHILRAAYESLALSLYDCYSAFPCGVTEIYVSGGGVQSDLLCQMFADIMGKTVKRPVVGENGICGITSLVRVGLKIEDFSKAPRANFDVFLPDAARHEKYIKLFDIYSELKKIMKDYWSMRSQYIGWPQS
ncbi:MAG: FGGY family carbohydrate kinase [Tepidanaerobacteraceae bacterium]|jgi:sugar (pentulose or hexulose) kinase|nr:FGGY family carbohydrate kinase [Tepidanaerobacteraceae bacterium]